MIVSSVTTIFRPRFLAVRVADFSPNEVSSYSSPSSTSSGPSAAVNPGIRSTFLVDLWIVTRPSVTYLGWL